jgi:hypothetical protein
MNIEPVAYINVEERKLEWAGPVEWGTSIIAKADKVPLYTRQTQDLTDEEIEQVWTEVTCQELNVPYSFAKAILRKAQEK